MSNACSVSKKPISTVSSEQELPGEKPLVIYDGDCGFCVNTVTRWLTRGDQDIDVIPYQSLGERLPTIDRNRCAKAVHLLDGNGVSRGALAVLRIRAHLAGRTPSALLRIPAWFLAPGYWLIAHNRGLANRIVFGAKD